MDKERDQQKPQFPEDQHGPGYDNDTSGWVDGKTDNPYPHFDKGNAWRKQK